MKCKIPKFELYRVQIDDFTSAILTQKMVQRLGQVYCETPSHDKMFGSIVLFMLTDFLL